MLAWCWMVGRAERVWVCGGVGGEGNKPIIACGNEVACTHFVKYIFWVMWQSILMQVHSEGLSGFSLFRFLCMGQL